MHAGTSDAKAALLLRLLLGSLFIAHLYWKFAVLPGGLETWWGNLLDAGYPPAVPVYVLSADRNNGSWAVNHANNAQTDRDFRIVILG